MRLSKFQPGWWAVAALSAAAHGQIAGPGAVVETTELAAPRGLAARPAPTPRSVGMPGAANPTADIVMPALGPDDVVGPGARGLLRNGRVFPAIANSDVDGAWSVLADGSMLWTLTIESPNAEGLRARIEPFDPPAGTELVVYDPDDATESFGPYTARHARGDLPFWTPRVFGRRMRLEWFVPARAAAGVFGSIQVTGVAQLYPHAPTGVRGGECKIDVTCHPTWNTTAQSVASFEFITGDGEGAVCSGALVTRHPTADLCPIFLTAGHCIETQAEANSMDIFWFFQTSVCDGVAPNRNLLPRSTGGLILRRDGDADVCLLGLAVDEIPAGVTFAGWTSAEAPDPTPATMIHHPEGLRKSWSTGDLVGIEDVSQCWPNVSDTYDYELTNGGQDGGSSGAPVFDNSFHRIRAVATCSVTDDCVPDEDTGEGSLFHGYPTLAVYMTPRQDVWVQPGWPLAEDGSSTGPFNTLLEGWYAVAGGGTLHLRPGSAYPGAFLFQGPRGMTLTAENGPVRIGE